MVAQQDNHADKQCDTEYGPHDLVAHQRGVIGQVEAVNHHQPQGVERGRNRQHHLIGVGCHKGQRDMRHCKDHKESANDVKDICGQRVALSQFQRN